MQDVQLRGAHRLIMMRFTLLSKSYNSIVHEGQVQDVQYTQIIYHLNPARQLKAL